MNIKINNLLTAVENRYDPENDTPPGPEVSFADSCLVEVIREQQRLIDDLQTQVDELRQTLNEIGL